MQPMSLSDLGDFINMIEHGFANSLFYGFTCMIAFAVAVYIKCLIVDGNS